MDYARLQGTGTSTDKCIKLFILTCMLDIRAYITGVVKLMNAQFNATWTTSSLRVKILNISRRSKHNSVRGTR